MIDYIEAVKHAQKTYTETNEDEFLVGLNLMMTNKRDLISNPYTSDHTRMLLTLSEDFQNMLMTETYCSIGYYQDLIPFYNVSPEIVTITANKLQGKYGFVMVEQCNCLSRLFKQPRSLSVPDVMAFSTENMFGLTVGNIIRRMGYYYVPKFHYFDNVCSKLMVGEKIQLFFGDEFDKDKPIFVEEYITNAITLNDRLKQKLKIKCERNLNQRERSEMSEVMVQMIGFIHLLRSNFNGAHNDFHSQNILVQKFKEPIYVPITDDIQIKTMYVVRVIDFGMCSFTLASLKIDLYNKITNSNKIVVLRKWYKFNGFDLDALNEEEIYYSIDNFHIFMMLSDYSTIMGIPSLYIDQTETKGFTLNTSNKIMQLLTHVNDVTHGDVGVLLKSRNDYFRENFVFENDFNKSVYLQNVCDLVEDGSHRMSLQQRRILGLKQILKIQTRCEKIRKSEVSQCDKLISLAQLVLHLHTLSRCMEIMDLLNLEIVGRLRRCFELLKAVEHEVDGPIKELYTKVQIFLGIP